MFAVVYRWRVIAGREAQFEEGWSRGTERIAAEFGGWGSRLHKGADGAFAGPGRLAAYAYSKTGNAAFVARAVAGIRGGVRGLPLDAYATRKRRFGKIEEQAPAEVVTVKPVSTLPTPLRPEHVVKSVS